MATETFPDIAAHRSSPGHDTEFKTLESNFGDGYTQAVAEGLNSERESWNLVWENEDIADVQTIKTFLKARAGYQPFYWTAPGEETPKTWRCKKFSSKPVGPYAETLTATFERWFGPVS